MMVVFHRAWTMPIRSELPSCCWAEGPLTVDIVCDWVKQMCKNRVIDSLTGSCA
jgi:hypothetical protein